ncbi:iron-sulfur cluster repair protein YtfE [Luteitalea sp. TBR-22]|uniref:iron-sulfur cluster repair di-iron protein n=1 Tax=Luteitalea sp. TBR-22 TaxID=2802971 RepID=UPI001AF1E8F9|nr:iron-sulfur cluster repair di-iron protein [Luteitalea sp. TBR-22]BCS32356.1 iron-sulfur cluster repair protein YtfE [Luteitalea sp. TBR-22]
MVISPESTVADIATQAPATIAIFQRHQIDFCCGGRQPLGTVCAERGINADLLVTELVAAATPANAEPTWADATLTALVGHIQQRYHAHLRQELPRLAAMVDKVVSRHGDHLPDVLPPLQETFAALTEELLTHMEKEDRVLFPFIVGLDQGRPVTPETAEWIAAPISVMEAEHESAGAALATMRQLTDDYTPPEWACPTFRGLYFGLSQFETDMHLHVHLENHILFPRAAQLAARRA